MMLALFAEIVASQARSSRATIVLLNVTLLRSCLPIKSSAAFAFAIASFVIVSTASGVCGQSGMVRYGVFLCGSCLEVVDRFCFLGKKRRGQKEQQETREETFHKRQS